MAAIFTGKTPGPPRKRKQPTQTTKAHRFEPFSKRVARLRIDPVHTVQKSRVTDSGDDLSQSFFKNALDEWAELNLSQTFTTFYNQVHTLTESLPQVLYHADKIATVLLSSIEKCDPLALEALLSLVAHFAHDLGQSFGKYFERTVSTVLRLPNNQEDPAVVEWCFTCLAWIYKYLSRLLVSDLRPLLDIVLPYFSARKDYVRRFTAESVAFLIRKAAVLYSKNRKPMTYALEHVFAKISSTHDEPERNSIQGTVSVLLAESAIGVDAQLHSGAKDLLMCALDVIREQTVEQGPLLDAVASTFVNLIHRTDASGFAPFQDLVLTLNDTDSSLPIRMRLLTLLVLTRRGSRVSDWTRVMKALIGNSTVGSSNEMPLPMDHILQSSAAIIQYAPLNELLPNLNQLLKLLAELSTRNQFFAFSDLVAQLGRPRFDDILLPFLQDYIQHSASTERDNVCLHISRLSVLDERPTSKLLQIPTSLSANIVSESADFPDTLLAVHLARVAQFPGTTSQKKALSTRLRRHVDAAIRAIETGNESIDQLENRAMLGWGFQSLLGLQQKTSSFVDLPRIMNSADRRLFSITPFLQACISFLHQTPQASNSLNHSHVHTTLIENLQNESTELRRASLDLLLAINQPSPQDWLNQVYDVLFEIIETPYSISNARQLAMLVRKLPFLQKDSPGDESLKTVIPVFCLGLLLCYHDQLHRDVCEVLAQMTTSTDIEEIVFSAVRKWLDSSHTIDLRKEPDKVDDDAPLTAFDCSNVRDFQSRWRSAVSDYENASDLLFDQADKAHIIHGVQPPPNSRNIALQTLLHMPELAEKRSKVIVPAFLAAQKGRTSSSLTEDADSDHTFTQEADEQSWTLHERKLFLELLGKFQNPKVLYRQADVYAQLLDLLQNGDPAIRRLSLLAILKWKDRAVLDNQEALMKVADDKTSTVELGTMLHAEDESSPIKAGTREDVLPQLLRLVFGQLIGRVGVAGSQESKRKSLLRLLFRMPPEEIELFLSIALGRLKDVSMIGELPCKQYLISQDLISLDQQYGFLRMCLSMIEILQTQFAPYGISILNAVLYCTVRACHRLNAMTTDEHIPALVRNIRRTGIQVLDLIFKHCPGVAWDGYKTLVFDQIVNPRLPNFATENAHSVSTLLRMFATWAHSDRLAQWLTKGSGELLPAVSSLLSHSMTKDIVKLFVVEEIVAPLVDTSLGEPIDTVLNQNQLNLLLNEIAELLQVPPSKPLLLETTKIVSKLASSDVPSGLQTKIIELLIGLLDQHNSKLPPHIKGQILGAIGGCVTNTNTSLPEAVRMQLWNKVSAYLDFFKDRTNRRTCCTILSQTANGHPDMVLAAEICDELNAYSTSSLDDIDHDRISTGFALITDKLPESANNVAQLPVLHNLLFLLRINEDISVRSNTLSCLKHLLRQFDSQPESSKKLATEKILLSAIRKNLKNPSETVRADFVILLGAVVAQKHGDEAEAENLADMKPLLVGGDEEASFFNNILHIQVHRRTRALKRLTDTISQGQISANHIAEYLLPLVESFAEEQSVDESAQNTKGQSIAALAVILRWLDWKTFRKILRHYKQGLDSASEDSRSALRLLAHAADALTAAKLNHLETTKQSGVMPFLASSLPSVDVLAEELKSNLIPRLTEFSHYKDEEEISVRLPAAIVAIKFIGLLSEADVILLASPIVLDVAQILRSRTQETRDMARKILAEIVTLLGSHSIEFVLKELRTTLTQGYQLHVLGYTLHTILLVAADSRQTGDLDYCIADLVKVIMDDIFGTTGRDKDNQDYISSMKEVKSSKGFDSMEILAQNTSVHHLSKLVLPFESLFAGSLTTKQLRHADDLLRRIGVGISHNPHAGSQDLLVFTFELIQTFYKSKPQVIPAVKTNDQKNRERFLVQAESSSKTAQSTSAALLYKLAKFAVDVARSTFSRHPELMKPENVQGFLPILGDALVDGQNDVKISALRLLTTVIKLPINELEENSKLYVLEAVKIVKAAISTNEEAAQAALKLVSSIIRDRRSVDIRDSDIAYLLKRTMPDLEEPDRQGVTFNFVKAVMARKLQLPEVYELVDKIGVMMVTSQSRSSREAARGVYVHFLLDYPQSKTRWMKQMKFILKNFEYQYPEGRQCVMEATNILLNKLERHTASEFASVVFMPVVLRMANDDNERCRELAGALLSQVFRKTAEDDLSDMIEPLRAWLAQNDNMELKKVSMQAWWKYFELELPNAQAEVAAARKVAHSLLKRHTDDGDSDDNQWETKYHALGLLSSLATHHPQDLFSDNQEDLWTYIRTLLSSPHSWLQSSAMNLLGLFFRECIAAGSVSVPLACSYGLAFDTSAIIQIIRSCMRNLKHSHSEGLTSRTIQNVLFLARCADTSHLQMSIKRPEQLAESEDDHSASDNSDNDTDSPASFTNPNTSTIPATQYILDQSARTLRREPRKLTTATLQPKLSTLTLLTSLIPLLSRPSLPTSSITTLLLPLHRYTSTTDSSGIPRSADPTFPTTYNTLISQSHEVLETLQNKLGDKEYVQCVTAATRIARAKKLERRSKRNIERVADPEAAARNKRRKAERGKARRKEIGHIHRGKRRHDLGF